MSGKAAPAGPGGNAFLAFGGHLHPLACDSLLHLQSTRPTACLLVSSPTSDSPALHLSQELPRMTGPPEKPGQSPQLMVFIFIISAKPVLCHEVTGFRDQDMDVSRVYTFSQHWVSSLRLWVNCASAQRQPGRMLPPW